LNGGVPMLYKKNEVNYKTVLVAILIGVVLTGLMLLYSQNYTSAGFVDALFVAGFLLFALGWFFFISNENVFSLVIYGVQSFWLNMVGKRKEKSYIEYITEKPKISSYIYKTLWIASLPFLLISVILLFA
jgi:hypothetical protein